MWSEGVTFSHDGRMLVSVGGVSGRPGEVHVWDLTAKEEPR